jgi:hypothetical protein
MSHNDTKEILRAYVCAEHSLVVLLFIGGAMADVPKPKCLHIHWILQQHNVLALYDADGAMVTRQVETLDAHVCPLYAVSRGGHVEQIGCAPLDVVHARVYTDTCIDTDAYIRTHRNVYSGRLSSVAFHECANITIHAASAAACSERSGKSLQTSEEDLHLQTSSHESSSGT